LEFLDDFAYLLAAVDEAEDAGGDLAFVEAAASAGGRREGTGDLVDLVGGEVVDAVDDHRMEGGALHSSHLRDAHAQAGGGLGAGALAAELRWGGLLLGRRGCGNRVRHGGTSVGVATLRSTSYRSTTADETGAPAD